MPETFSRDKYLKIPFQQLSQKEPEIEDFGAFPKDGRILNVYTPEVTEKYFLEAILEATQSYLASQLSVNSQSPFGLYDLGAGDTHFARRLLSKIKQLYPDLKAFSRFVDVNYGTENQNPLNQKAKELLQESWQQLKDLPISQRIKRMQEQNLIHADFTNPGELFGVENYTFNLPSNLQTDFIMSRYAIHYFSGNPEKMQNLFRTIEKLLKPKGAATLLVPTADYTDNPSKYAQIIAFLHHTAMALRDGIIDTQTNLDATTASGLSQALEDKITQTYKPNWYLPTTEDFQQALKDTNLSNLKVDCQVIPRAEIPWILTVDQFLSGRIGQFTPEQQAFFRKFAKNLAAKHPDFIQENGYFQPLTLVQIKKD